MAQSAVKVFFHQRHGELAKQLTEWITQVSGRIQIQSISIDSNEYGHCLSILYSTGGEQHFYRPHLWFSSRHSELEQLANQGLAAAGAQHGRFIAMGSNQYGHCLCVIEEQ